jgi:hypothetical protein
MKKLIDAVIEDLKKGFEQGDYTVLEELLKNVPFINLVHSLPEEEWNKHKPSHDYFSIVHQGYNKEVMREEVQIHGGENANIFLIKTDEGFVIDVYGQNDLENTMTVWEDDIAPLNQSDEIN